MQLALFRHRYSRQQLSWSLLLVLTWSCQWCGAAAPDGLADGLFARLDQDGDGQIASSEISADKRSWFERLVRTSDTDGDSRLSAAEFAASLQSHRPGRPMSIKGPSELPGSRALLLLLAWMDKNADMTIDAAEVPENLFPTFKRFVDVLGPPTEDRIRINQLRNQAPRFANMAQRYAQREGIDVELELALLDDAHYALVERIESPGRAGQGMANRDNARALFDRLDQDGTGKVKIADLREEVRDRIGPLLNRVDRNRDGVVTEQEFLALQSRGADSARPRNTSSPASNAAAGQALVERLDRDGDGLLSREEIPPRLAQRFSRVDANGDDRLDEQELSRVANFLRQLRASGRIPAESASPAP